MSRDLNELRKEIDVIDTELLKLLEKRFELTDEIGCYKAENRLKIFDGAREAQKLQAIYSDYSESRYRDKFCGVFKALMNESKISQSQKIYGKNTVFLIGMPGCGKTTVGKILSDMLFAEHLDLDAEFKNLFRATPSMFINQMGEQKFRLSEALVLKLVIDRINNLHNRFENAGFVISCGGGIVVRPENIETLKANGSIVYIKRKLEELDNSDRPLSQTKGIAQLYEERKNLYESCADISVDNNDPTECAEMILNMLSAKNVENK